MLKIIVTGTLISVEKTAKIESQNSFISIFKAKVSIEGKSYIRIWNPKSYFGGNFQRFYLNIYFSKLFLGIMPSI